MTAGNVPVELRDFYRPVVRYSIGSDGHVTYTISTPSLPLQQGHVIWADHEGALGIIDQLTQLMREVARMQAAKDAA